MSYKPVPPSRWRPPGQGVDQAHGATDASQTVRPPDPAAVRSGPLATAGKWRFKALGGLLLIYVSVVTGLYTPWALVLLWWAVGDLQRGETWFLETVRRDANPWVYALLLGSWLVLGVLMIGLDFAVFELPASGLGYFEE